MAESSLPRLPDVPKPAPQAEQLQIEWTDATGEAATGEAATGEDATVGDSEWVTYEEPELASLTVARRLVVTSRAVVVAWGVALIVAVIVVRRDAADGFDDGSLITVLGWVGIVVAVAVSAAGWFWADRSTQNVHRLAASLPTRLRCASAWIMPLGWAGLLAVTILQLGPTELVDLRPVLVVMILAAAMWRPYSLVRRIIRSSIPVDSDVLVASGYVLDLTVFLLLWWQFWTWPSDLPSANVGSADVMLGLAAATLVVSACGVVAWVLILRDIDRALAHRTVAVRTRHDHKQLRQRGIDPMNPQVRTALLKLHEEDAERSQGAGDGAATSPPGALRSDERQAADRPAPADERRVAVAEPVVAEPVPVVSDEGRSIADALDDGIRDVADGVAAPDDKLAPRLTIERDDEVAKQEVPGDGIGTAIPADETSGQDLSRVGERAPAPGPGESAPDQDESQAAEPVESAQEPDEPPVAEPGESIDGPALPLEPDPASLVDRLAMRAEAMEPSGSADEERLERMARRLSGSTGRVVGDDSLLDRLAKYGIVAGSDDITPGLDFEDGDATDHDDGELMVEKLYSLELARSVLLLFLAASAAASIWLVSLSGSAGDLVNGALSQSSVERIDVARRVFVSSIGATLAVVTLWCGVAATWARRVGADVRGEVRSYVLFVLSVGVNMATFIVDGDIRGMTSLIGIAACMAAALWAIPVGLSIQKWFDRRTAALSAWSAALVFVVASSWVGGFQRPIEAADSLEALSFFGVFQTVSVMVSLTLVAVGTADVEKTIRLAPSSNRSRRLERAG